VIDERKHLLLPHAFAQIPILLEPKRPDNCLLGSSNPGKGDLPMDHSKHAPLRAEELTSANLDGAKVYGPDDNHVGDVAHLHGSGPQAKAVVDVGGFLGIGAKPVALSLSSLNLMRDESGTVHATTAMTKDQLKDLPEHIH
jgi:hypothetical protein